MEMTVALQAPRVGRHVLLATGISGWAAALFGSLQLHKCTDLVNHNICGPWGCTAKPEALLGYHLFLLSLLLPTLVLVSRWLKPAARRPFGWSLLAVGLIGATIVAGEAAISWRQQARTEADRSYTLNAAGFALATKPDLPVIPLTLSGLACLLLSARSSRAQSDRPEQFDADAAENQETP